MITEGILNANKAAKQKKAQNDDSAQTVVVKNKYSIDVPSFLSPTTKLSEDASLQYMNRTLDVSFIVIDEPKSDFLATVEEMKKALPDFGQDSTMLDQMAAIVLGNFFEDLDKVEIGDRTETTINGLKALTLNAFQKRTFLKDALYGTFAFIEGRDTLYQVIILSGGTSIVKLADKLGQSIHSFKEL